MKKIPEWYVITGGPGSGKTTTLEHIAKLGYYTVPEDSRMYIDRELAKGKTIEEIRGDKQEFQNHITKVKFQLEKKTPNNKTVFMDRGMPDLLAYYRYLKLKLPKNLVGQCKNRYKKIFLLGMLPFKNDYARIETEKEAKMIHKTIKKTYMELGYKVVRIPVASVEKRVKMILKHIK
ncbi:MAG: ATP-binding protein [Candidatus Aenigmarchaeota archaeon]|nr:ATP-binding protein [Candidatus Aenigmarchaeota archaeon]